ncbi:AT hook motif DNA-binding family protein [Actinidia rufa]|uniref:AT-hook motif nuclear-localized protein n=1 Tax=Actinidia rufa TaxID=165716 RepID=A0A7J0G7U9_9ERIC|nr:AT hook motif DNA-binding family protein [Actinidia rufa]
MDRREAMAVSGSNYYMQRGMGGSGSGPFQSLSNPNVSFQSNIGGGSMGSTLSIEPSPVVSPHGVNAGAPSFVPSAEPVRRKRGRPRKYGPDGAVSLALLPASSTPPVSVTPTQKRGRGRPPGTGRKQQLAYLGEWLSGSAGMGFTPHVITIAIGEDITTKIMSFSQQGPRAIYIMSANGSVSTVTLRQPSTSGGSVTYEGRFEIICLSGSYLVTDNGGSRGRTGGLSVLLASPDGRVIGGGVGGSASCSQPCSVQRPRTRLGQVFDGAGNLDRQTDDNPAALASTPPSQNLTPTSSVNVWPGSRPMDMQNAHVDIDLMRE